MKLVFPSAVELSIFATFAVLAALIFPFVRGSAGGIIALGFPMVLTCMLLGARRNGKLNPAPATAVAPAEQSA